MVAYCLLERIGRLLFQVHLDSSCHSCRYLRGGEEQGGESVVGSRVPEVLDEFGPALVKIGRATGIAGQLAEKQVGVVVRGGELPPLAGDGDLVGLLVILAGGVVVGHLSGQGVVCHALQVVGPLHVPCDLQYRFQ